MKEEFKEIEGYESLYWVSNFGRVKNKKRFMTNTINLDGYYVVNLSKCGKTKTFVVHRLVAKTFIPNPDNLPQVNHKDENKLNNIVSNLEWCTLQYNHNYGSRNRRTGLSQRYSNKCKPVLQFSLDNTFIKEFPSLGEAQRQLGFMQHNISKCCRGQYTQAYGYIWKFK